MKKRILAAALLICVVVVCAVSCGTPEGLWADADYLNDTTLGEGAQTVTVTVEAEKRSVTFTVKTDAATLADALVGVGLISGEETQYGLTVSTVNGMTADFDTGRVYWALYVGDDYAMTGVSHIEINDGDTYSFVYEKA